MDNFTIYKNGRYDIKYNMKMKLEKVATVLIAADYYFHKELGRN